MRAKCSFVLPAAAAALLAAAPAHAACVPAPLATLDTAVDERGKITIPATIEGEAHRFELELSGPSSFVSSALADHLAMAKDGAPHAYTAHEIRFQNARAHDVLLRAGSLPSGTLAGGLGVTFWKDFDVELDLAANTVKLYANDGCRVDGVPGAESSASLPLEFQPSGHVMTHMTLDGHDVTTGFSLETFPAMMHLSYGFRIFGLTEASPGMPPATAPLLPSMRPAPRYLHRFGRLEAGRVVLDNPDVELSGAATDAVCDGTAQNFGGRPLICYSGGGLILGLDEIRELRLYFAFKRGQLFVAKAE